MREVDKSLWPPRPHFGGPLPVLSTATQLAVAIEICDAMRALGEGSLVEYDSRAALARRISEGERIPSKELDKISKTSKADTPMMRIAKQTLRAAYNHLYAAVSARNVVGTCVENAAISSVQYQIECGGDEAGRAFLRFIDDAVMRCELRAALAEKAIEPSADVTQVVSRPRGSTKGLALVMARLADGNFGLFVKLKQRWQWHEGERESVFATVPDEFMRAVMADIDPGFKRTQA